MQIKSLFFALFAATAAFAQAPDPAINTPEGVTECLPVLLTFSGSAPPFIITVQPGGQAGAAPLTTVGTTSADSITWLVNLPAGTQCTLVIRDSLGRTNPSAVFTILTGTTGCLTASASSTSGATGVVTPPATTPATTAVVSSVPVTTAVVVTANGVTSTAQITTNAVTTAAATTTKKSGASTLQPMCMAGFMGLVGAVAFL